MWLMIDILAQIRPDHWASRLDVLPKTLSYTP